jgi:hypothetical protein
LSVSKLAKYASQETTTAEHPLGFHSRLDGFSFV